MSRNKVYQFLFALAAIIITLQFISFQSLDLSNNIDGSWPYTLSTLRHGSQVLGRDIFYTYGPYFNKIATYPVPSDGVLNFFVGVFSSVLLLAGVGYIVYNFSKQFWHKVPDLSILLFGLITLMVTIGITGIDSAFYFLLLACALSIRNVEKKHLKLLLAVAILPFALYKTSFSIAYLALMGLSSLPRRITRRTILTSLQLYLLIVGCFTLFYSVVTPAYPHQALDYLRVGIVNSAAYTEFMSLSFRSNTGATLTFLAVYYATFIITIASSIYHHRRDRIELNKIKPRDLEYIIVFAVSFFALKQAVVRSDFHLVTFIPFMPVLIFTAYDAFSRGLKKPIKPNPRFNKYAYVVVIALIIMTTGLQIHLYQQEQGLEYIKGRALALYRGIVQSPLDYKAFRGVQGDVSRQAQARSKTLAGINRFLASNYDQDTTVYFYGNTTLLGDSINGGKNVHYMPFVQNYAAFPPQFFNNKYIDALPKEVGSLLVVEELEPSINERIPSHELSKYFEYIRANYRHVYVDKRNRIYLLERVSSSEEACRRIESIKQRKGSQFAVPVPNLSKQSYIKLQVVPPINILESAIAGLAKAPLYSLDIRSAEGGFLSRRTTLSTLSYGISVHPFFASYTDVVDKSAVNLASLAINGGINKDAELELNFYQCRYQ